MTSPYYQSQGGGYSDALAGMYDSAGALQLKEIEQRYKLGKDEIGARLKIAGQQSKDTRYGIDAQRDSEREKLAQVREEMERVGIPRMLIEKYVAEKTYEIAQAEMSLKRDKFVEESAQAREKLRLDREEMERIGIPRVDIERYVAQQNAEIARGNFGVSQGQLTGYYGGNPTLDRAKFASDAEYQRAQLAQQQRQFETTASGYMQQPGSLSAEQRGRYEQIRARDQQLQAAGEAGVTGAERAELAGYEDILAGRSGGSQGQATLDRERFGADEAERLRLEAERQRRYALDVGKFGAELASTPDTYFQARRFQGVDVPRLLGGAGAATSDVQGGPTPGVATMGAYLSGQNPYGGSKPEIAQAAYGSAGPDMRYAQGVSQEYAPGAASVGDPAAARLAAAGAPTLAPAAAPLSPQEQARYEQLVARKRQLDAAGEPVPPVDADELARFQARMGVGATYNDPAFAGGPLRGGPIDQYGAPVGGGGIPGMGGPTGGMLRGGPIDPYGAPIGKPETPQSAYGSLGPDTRYAMGGGGYENIDPVSGGSTLPLSTFRGTNSYSPTASVYGGPAVSASVGPQGYYAPQRPSAPSPYPSQDPRQKQLAALAKALPPSPWDGLDDSDSAALTAMQAIYKKGGQAIAGGEYERLQGSGRLGFMQSAGRLLGYDPKELESQYKSYRPSQGSSRSAG